MSQHCEWQWLHHEPEVGLARRLWPQSCLAFGMCLMWCLDGRTVRRICILAVMHEYELHNFPHCFGLHSSFAIGSSDCNCLFNKKLFLFRRRLQWLSILVVYRVPTLWMFSVEPCRFRFKFSLLHSIKIAFDAHSNCIFKFGQNSAVWRIHVVADFFIPGQPDSMTGFYGA